MFQLFYLLKGQSCPWASCHMGKFKDLKLQSTVCLDFFPSSVLPFIFLLSFHLLIVVCNTAYIKKEYFLWQYTNGMDWHYLFSFGSYPNMRYLFSTDYQTNGKYSMKKQYKSFQESSVKVIGSLFKQGAPDISNVKNQSILKIFFNRFFIYIKIVIYLHR